MIHIKHLICLRESFIDGMRTIKMHITYVYVIIIAVASVRIKPMWSIAVIFLSLLYFVAFSLLIISKIVASKMQNIQNIYMDVKVIFSAPWICTLAIWSSFLMYRKLVHCFCMQIVLAHSTSTCRMLGKVNIIYKVRRRWKATRKAG